MLFVLKRLSFIFMVVWAASTITFFIPRISDVNPIRERFAELARLGGFAPGDLEKIVEAYNKAFGLDKSLWVQYDYMSGVLRLTLVFRSISFQNRINAIAESSWTIGLLLVTTIFSFVIGNLMELWPHGQSPKWVRSFSTSCILFQGIPPVLLAIFLILFWFTSRNFPDCRCIHNRFHPKIII